MIKVSKTPKSEAEVRLRIVLIAPPPSVDFGVQEGKGSDCTTIHKQRTKDADPTFEFTVTIKNNREDGMPNFLGPLTHGQRRAASFTSTSENLPGSSTLVGIAASRFPWVESLGK